MSQHHIRALELASKGCWEDAHAMIQSSSDRLSCLIHGYLHRLEGDHGNARYWYARGGEDLAANLLRSEWSRLFDIARRAGEG
jgi:hypothetical protein